MNLPQEEAYDEFKTAREIVGTLRGQGCFWHRTSVDSLQGIFNTGGIMPNDGRFEVTYPQSNNCLSRHYSSVSLFDFDSKSVNEILDQAWKWECFVKDRGYATVLICIDKMHLDLKKIIYPWEIPFEKKLRVSATGTEYLPSIIPDVEILYQGTIPPTSFSKFLIVKKARGFQYETITGPNPLGSIKELSSLWENEAKLEASALLRHKENLSMVDYLTNPLLYDELFKDS